jgi:threonine dehydrogenase-like Zn-dependent dehydrogenase
VDFPKIEKPDAIILKVTATAICGSDLHIHDGFVPQMKNMGSHLVMLVLLPLSFEQSTNEY